MANQDDSGSFLTGFTLGMFAGAASLFLFGTERGNKVRSRMAEEWEEAKEYLEEEGVIEKGKTTIRDVFKSVVDNIQQRQSEAKKAKPKAKPQTIAKKPTSKSAPKKFKRTK